MKEINFSDLTQDLKKQFLYFLARNNINFYRLRDSNCLRTKIRITNSQSGRSAARIVLKPEDIESLCRERNAEDSHHLDSAQLPWKHRRKMKHNPHIEKGNRLPRSTNRNDKLSNYFNEGNPFKSHKK